MFIKNQYYHVYNQGNNKRKLFFTEADYQLFLFKAKSYITPFADIRAYCIMPNHYHFMLHVKENSMERKLFKKEVEGLQKQYLKNNKLIGRLRPLRLKVNGPNEISLHDSIAIIQRSYTRAINRKRSWSGSMFRCNYKFKDGWNDKFIDLDDEQFYIATDYIPRCIEYIHMNPVRAKLCDRPEDWKYSSASEYSKEEL